MRRYQDQVEVRLGDPGEHRVRLEDGWRRGAEPVVEEVPTLFLWHGRVHVVRGVLAQWTQRLPWWRDGVDGRLEQEVWRVEASAGRSAGTGVYELRKGETWLLERVSD
ncbi:DUF6504 family protein [Ornithinimicrobium sp. Y1847]|uniref:DUF6504 family protein n=1 Tax=unclassified Ornithinimicrobium TaxID=2615080 RepID=UPI003B67431C